MEHLNQSKWKKNSIMIENKDLQPYLPETSEFSKSNLWKLIDKYRKVILKPSNGSWGKNIFKLSLLSEDIYEIHFKDEKMNFTSRDEAFAYLKDKIASRPYLVQRYIPLLTINSSPLDIRVITQKTNDTNTWMVTGKLAKVAGKGFIVTNYKSGGAIIPVEQAIKDSCTTISTAEMESLHSEIDRVTLIASDCLEPYYKEQRIFGFDIGVDEQGHIWIIEVNLRPSLALFYQLEDKSTYWSIKKIRNDWKKLNR
jgi:glutathione synthase/RimK-type ligase-like ATP-grasp enzyme